MSAHHLSGRSRRPVRTHRLRGIGRRSDLVTPARAWTRCARPRALMISTSPPARTARTLDATCVLSCAAATGPSRLTRAARPHRRLDFKCPSPGAEAHHRWSCPPRRGLGGPPLSVTFVTAVACALVVKANVCKNASVNPTNWEMTCRGRSVAIVGNNHGNVLTPEADFNCAPS